jgi:hypothetical protein
MGSYFRRKVSTTTVPSYIKMVKLRRERIGYRTDENCLQGVVRKSEGERLPGRARHRWKFNRKMHLEEVVREKTYFRLMWLRVGTVATC